MGSASMSNYWDGDYFNGYRSHRPHPWMGSTGSEGRCDICGRMQTRDHEPPWQRATEMELEEERRAVRRAEAAGTVPLAVSHAWDKANPSGEGMAGDYLAHVRELRRPRRQALASAEIEALTTKEDTMTTINRSWAPDYLARYYFDQDEAWITAAGVSHRVDEMELDHCLNALLMLERVADDLPFPADTLQDKALYKALYKRVLDALPAPATPHQFRRVSLTLPETIKSYLQRMADTGRAVTIYYTDRTGAKSAREVRIRAVTRSQLRNDWLVKATQNEDGAFRSFYLQRIDRVEGPAL
jgi:hypothetical protein